MTTLDGELIPSPGPAAGAPPDEGAHAWFDVALRLGTSMDELIAQQKQQLRWARGRMGMEVPIIRSAVVPASGSVLLDFGTPSMGREWTIRRLSALDTTNPAGVTSGGTATANSGTFAAGAAGSSILPAGANVTGFDINVLPAGAPVQGLATVTGLLAAIGNMNYEVNETTAGTSLSVRYPGAGLAPASAAATPQVNMPVIAGGAAYSMAIYGTTAVVGAVPGSGFWYLGLPTLATLGPDTGIWPVQALPFISRFGSGNITALNHDHVILVLNNVTPGHLIVARVDVDDHIPGNAHLTQPV